MATIVLNAVGFALGGPIGAALGGLAGRALDQRIFGGSQGRDGPRLKELDVQTSSYGSEVPALFGAMRVAGTVFWATDLIEQAESEGGGKGRPVGTHYSYSVSFAVALSSRPASHVGRIWADGNLLRGAAGDMKVETGFRFYNGHGHQVADPLLAQAEGAEAPGFRGIAYAMFEDLQLADFGNRIPSLSFELFERDGGVRLVEIAAEVSQDIVGGDDPAMVTGFAASGSARDVVQLLVDGAGLRMARDHDGYRLGAPTASSVEVDDPVAMLDAERINRPERSRPPLGDCPQSIEYRHYDVARDYQAGLQRADRAGGGRGVLRIDFPAAMGADEAMSVAETLARRMGAERERLTLCVANGANELRAGSTLDWGGARWIVAELEHRRGAMLFTAKALGRSTPIAAGGVAGRAVRQRDATHGPTRLMLVELPDIMRIGSKTPVVVAAAGGLSSGWRRAALSIGHGADALRPVGSTAAPAVMGTVETPMIAAGRGLIDTRNRPSVRLLNDRMVLADADRDALLSGANLALIGGEVVQFEQAAPLGAGLYQLSHLHRGLFGTAIVDHDAGVPFLLLQRDWLRVLEGPELAPGRTLHAAAVSVGDEEAVLAETALTGIATLPLTPVHLVAERSGDGTLQVRWIRCSRLGAPWSADVEPPLGEERELYRLVAATEGGAALAAWDVAAPSYDVPAAQLSDWTAAGVERVRITVRQIGRHGLSPPATLSCSLI